MNTNELSNKPCIGGVEATKCGEVTPQSSKLSQQNKTPTFQRLQMEFATPTSRKSLTEGNLKQNVNYKSDFNISLPKK